MQPVADYKQLGLLAFVLLLTGLLVTVTVWPQGKHKTFSQHVAAHKKAIIYYIGLFTVTLPLLLLFFIGWFAPTFQLPIVWFSLFIIASSLMQYTCTLIPEVGGWKTKYHRFFAEWSASLLILPLLLITFSDHVPAFGKVLATLSIFAMLGIIYLYRIGKHSHVLLLQAGYYGAFFLPVLAITYLA